MLLDIDPLMFAIVTAFVSGWVVSRVGSYVSTHAETRPRDPRDARILSLEAELRVARSTAEKAKAGLEQTANELSDARRDIEERDAVLARRASSLDQLRADLRDSVKKTHELRAELADRAAENLRSEARLREVQTEFSLYQASTDLVGSGTYASRDEEEGGVQVFRAGG
jgi:chromosome segregation ATPase